MAEPIRVLHVDDDPEFVDVAADSLERQDDRIETVTATSVADGLDRLADGQFDCVVSDYRMPDLDGLEFLAAVREEYDDLPFVLFTGEGSEAVAGEAISAGATDYLRKGGDGSYELLANRVRNAVERHRSRRRAADLERVRSLVGDLNRALVRATTREGIETEVTRIIGGADPFRFAWIGAVDTETGRVDPRASAGENGPCLEGITVSEDEPAGEGPVAVAIRERRVVVSRENRADPDSARWRGTAAEHGFRSVAAVPLEHGGTLYGLLAVYTARPHAFDEQERALLAQLGDDVAHAIHAVELRTELERHGTIVETLGDPVYALDAEGCYTFVNRAFLDRTGYPEEAILGEHVSKVFAEEDVERGRAVVRDLRREGGGTATFEVERITAGGERVVAENNVALLPADDGEFVGTAGVLRDITERTEREDVFDSGYSTADEGTGFGLSIVREIAEAHGWEVRATDSADGGARFEITGVEFAR